MAAARSVRRRIPPPLAPGCTVAVVSPAGPVRAGDLERGESFLRRRGYRVVRGPHALDRRGYLAGSDRERLSDLQRAIDDPRVDAIFFSRGGYGTTRLLDDLNLAPLARRPCLLLGFSDLTALLNLVTDRTGLVTYLGPMVASDMGHGLRGQTLDAFDALVGGGGGTVVVSCRPGTAEPGARRGFLRAGSVTAELAGGCLSMLVATLGTPYQPDLAGKILFWEEVNEPAYRVDRMLTQLRQAGLLSRIAGMVVGGLRGCAGAPGGGGRRRLLAELLAGLDCPVFFGFPCGHGPQKVLLPIGLPLTLDAARGQVVIGDGRSAL